MADALSVIAGVTRTPGAHLSQDWLKAFASFRKRILHLRWNDLVNLSPNQTVCLQLAQLLRQHLFTGAAEQLPEFAKAENSARFDVIEQERFVLSAHYGQRDFHGTKNGFLRLFSFHLAARLQKSA
jgi:hypothetical protein